MRLFIVFNTNQPKCWGDGKFHYLKHGSVCAQFNNNGLMRGLNESTGVINQFLLAEHVKKIKCNKANLRKFDKQLRSSK